MYISELRIDLPAMGNVLMLTIWIVMQMAQHKYLDCIRKENLDCQSWLTIQLEIRARNWEATLICPFSLKSRMLHYPFMCEDGVFRPDRSIN